MTSICFEDSLGGSPSSRTVTRSEYRSNVSCSGSA
jgi:hypothetical protein